MLHVVSYACEIVSVTLRETQTEIVSGRRCLGLRKTRQQETGENSIMRSSMTCIRYKTLFGRLYD